jgi:hypothetical protein
MTQCPECLSNACITIGVSDDTNVDLLGGYANVEITCTMVCADCDHVFNDVQTQPMYINNWTRRTMQEIGKFIQQKAIEMVSEQLDIMRLSEIGLSEIRKSSDAEDDKREQVLMFLARSVARLNKSLHEDDFHTYMAIKSRVTKETHSLLYWSGDPSDLRWMYRPPSPLDIERISQWLAPDDDKQESKKISEHFPF